MVGWRERSTDSDLLLLMAHRPRARTRAVGSRDTRMPFASLSSLRQRTRRVLELWPLSSPVVTSQYAVRARQQARCALEGPDRGEAAHLRRLAHGGWARAGHRFASCGERDFSVHDNSLRRTSIPLSTSIFLADRARARTGSHPANDTRATFANLSSVQWTTGMPSTTARPDALTQTVAPRPPMAFARGPLFRLWNNRQRDVF